MPQIISIIRLISNLYKNWPLTLEERKEKNICRFAQDIKQNITFIYAIR